VVLHGLLPHEHHSNLSDTAEHREEHGEADDFIDYLKLIFHTDLGIEHLESYNQVKGHDLAFDVSFEAVPDLPPLAKVNVFSITGNKDIHYPSLIAYHIPLLKQDFLTTTPFRGPPAMV